MIYGLIALLALEVGLYLLACREERRVRREWGLLIERARLEAEVGRP